MPAPRADHSQPSCIGPICSDSFAYTGRTKTNALAPKLYRAEMVTNPNTVERSLKTNRKPTEDRSPPTSPAAVCSCRSVS